MVGSELGLERIFDPRLEGHAIIIETEAAGATEKLKTKVGIYFAFYAVLKRLMQFFPQDSQRQRRFAHTRADGSHVERG